MKTVLTSSETLFEHQRTAIEKAFSCRIYDYYGMAERSVFATECSQHNGRHLNMDYGIAEFLNSEGKSVEYGQLGRIIATSLHNYAMPLIRYQTNDSSILLQEPCPCGCSFPLMEDVTTKQESIITLPDGRLISPSVMTHPFKPMHNIRESQIIQKELDRLFVRLVPDDNYTEDDEKQLRKAFHERLGEQVKLDIEYVNHIPKEKSGKFKWVISYIEPTF
jgi:phenylacetate-CoA ligase